MIFSRGSVTIEEVPDEGDVGVNPPGPEDDIDIGEPEVDLLGEPVDVEEFPADFKAGEPVQCPNSPSAAGSKSDSAPWDPYTSYEEWQLAQWLTQSGLPQGEIDKFLKLSWVSVMVTSFCSASIHVLLELDQEGLHRSASVIYRQADFLR